MKTPPFTRFYFSSILSHITHTHTHKNSVYVIKILDRSDFEKVYKHTWRQYMWIWYVMKKNKYFFLEEGRMMKRRKFVLIHIGEYISGFGFIDKGKYISRNKENLTLSSIFFPRRFFSFILKYCIRHFARDIMSYTCTKSSFYKYSFKKKNTYEQKIEKTQKKIHMTRVSCHFTNPIIYYHAWQECFFQIILQ